MAVAVYDNPATMRREAWQDGRLIADISLELMSIKGFNGHPSMFFPLNCGKWKHGEIRGDAEAIAK